MVAGSRLRGGTACGATLKRPMEFEAALLSPGYPKRRRCAPLPGSAQGLRSPDAEPPPLLFQMQSPPLTVQQSAPPSGERRLPTPGSSWLKKGQPTFTVRQV
ncbi:PREDICTED: akirin-1-like [Elephantulus edwardii]|uniref:akirin-1-like n=1 Tax=Elephantulus edwardii TaxID=28737 RepID=UPI0003F0A107|nr:PREDICTED: akirin-1-like [Elephantulus edwardii]